MGIISNAELRDDGRWDRKRQDSYSRQSYQPRQAVVITKEQRQKQARQVILDAQLLLGLYDAKSTPCWSSQALIQVKIDALTALIKSIELNIESPNIAAAAREIKQQYPRALNGIFSKTAAFLNQLETPNYNPLAPR